MKTFLILLSFNFIAHLSASASILPDPALTPGVLCTSTDPDFKDFEYPAKVARCNRNISDTEKTEVAKNYGNIPRADWPKYEFDHYMPLCAGGSNSPQNLWPQPIAEAKQKDVVEVEVCTGLRAGTMTQDQALQKIHDWFAKFSSNRTPASAQNFSNIIYDLKSDLIQTVSAAKYICEEVRTEQKSDSNLQIKFELIDNKTLQNIIVNLIENKTENEVVQSGPNQITGRMTKSKSLPLDQHYLFSIKKDKDRFDLYLPLNFASAEASTGKIYLDGYFKISFEDTYPKLVKVQCKESNH